MTNTMIASVCLFLAGAYVLCGLLFAIPFALVGTAMIDPLARKGSWGFRILIIPGTVALWPLLASRWLSRSGKPPEERNAHRDSVRVGL